MDARKCARTYRDRERDWRYGNLVYQVMVDRFVPSARLEEKAHCYTAPRKLLPWQEPLPAKHVYNHEERVASGEVVFYGGDLQSVRTKLDYLEELNIKTLYLNPIFEAFTNHKYDATDFFAIDPQYGNIDDLTMLADDLHSRGMRLMLDGVFNHVGRRSHWFQNAQANPNNGTSDYFTFRDSAPNGYLGWRNVANLPELNLENPKVQQLIWASDEAVIPHYIKSAGIDGWRLDVAPDIGPAYLQAITDAAHAANPESMVIGECYNYPEMWCQCMDGVMNMYLRGILMEMIEGKASCTEAYRFIEVMIKDTGTEGLLKSHIVLDNHDLPRLATQVPKRIQRDALRVLQMTLPGCPVIYYGSETGMKGGWDPYNRAPMDWDLMDEENEELAFLKKVIALREENRALRIGDIRLLPSEKVLAYMRFTDDPKETIVVMVNGGDKSVNAMVPVRDSYLMDCAPLKCLLTGEESPTHAGFLSLTIPAYGARMFRTADRGNTPGYSMFKRVP